MPHKKVLSWTVTQLGRFTVIGSHGVLLIEADGRIVEVKVPTAHLQTTPHEYDDIIRFDVEEYIKYNGCLDDTDILLIGYWTQKLKYGPVEYEPASLDQRNTVGPTVVGKLRVRLFFDDVWKLDAVLQNGKFDAKTAAAINNCVQAEVSLAKLIEVGIENQVLTFARPSGVCKVQLHKWSTTQSGWQYTGQASDYNPPAPRDTLPGIIPVAGFTPNWWRNHLPINIYHAGDDQYEVVSLYSSDDGDYSQLIPYREYTFNDKELEVFCDNTARVLRNAADLFEQFGLGMFDRVINPIVTDDEASVRFKRKTETSDAAV